MAENRPLANVGGLAGYRADAVDDARISISICYALSSADVHLC